jgi:hypothetical protein
LYEKIKEFKRENKISGPIKDVKTDFEKDMENYYLTTINRKVQIVLSMVMPGIDEDKIRMEKRRVLEMLNLLMKWIPRHKKLVNDARKILWNYFKIQDLIKFGEAYRNIFGIDMPKNGKFLETISA